MTTPADMLALAAEELRRAASQCAELVHDGAPDAPLVARLIERVAALADELCWELAPADPCPEVRRSHSIGHD